MRSRIQPREERHPLLLTLYLVGVAAAVVVAFGILTAMTTAATIPTEVRMNLSVSVKVDCRGNGLFGGVHSGSPDYRRGMDDLRSPLEQARIFARTTGVTGRFPGLVTQVHSTPAPMTTLVAFKEVSGTPRGVLQYYGSRSDGWQLVHAWYC